jgi:hypothetical protein
MKKTGLVVIAALAAGIMLSACADQISAAEQWIQLFNGKDLKGWTQRGGKATYQVVDGTIEGTTSGLPKDRNSFLCTDKNYGDFILELDFKVGDMNSGIQIRSESRPDYENGVVHGYQVEIDPSDRAWSGGLYEESRRGWLNNLLGNESARKAFKKDDWNHYRVEAVGDSIKTWVNGVQAADLIDSMTQTGFVALQVHASDKAGGKIWFKNIRIQDLGQHVWIKIFNGKNLDGWKTLGKGQWQVVNGEIQGTCGKDSECGTTLVFPVLKPDYTLRMQFKAVKGLGAMYLLSPKADCPTTLTGANAILDSAGDGMTGALADGSTVLLKPFWGGYDNWPTSKDERYKPGQWSLLSVSVHGKRVSVFIDNHRTAEIKDFDTPAEGAAAFLIKGGHDGEFLLKDIEWLVSEGK